MRIFDGTCNDGWMAANLWLGREDHGVEIECIDGMELNTDAAERARGRYEKYGIPGEIVTDDLHNAPEHFEPGSYDAVVLFETIEHVPDPAATLDLLVKMCKPDGRVYVSTPEGAFENGNLPQWFRVESKGHLRAMRPHDLCALLCERGVVEDWATEQALMVAALRPSPRRSKVIFYAAGAEALPETILTEGLGGSETALCKMAEHFARRGHDVRVYAGSGQGLRSDGVSVNEWFRKGQVLYAPHTEWDPGEKADLFVSCRVPETFDRTINATHRVLYLHDAEYGDRLTELRAKRASEILVLSEFQRELLAERYPFIAEKLHVSRNGIETSFFEGDLPVKEPIAVYSSSPDRGLEVLLELWPEVRKEVPDAELHFGYAPVYKAFAQVQDRLKALDRRLEPLIAQEGVVNFGSLGQKALADLYKRARCWLYPSYQSPEKVWFPEISCLSGDTLIDVPRDHRTQPNGVPIADLEGRINFPIWAWNETDRRFEIATAKKCWRSKRSARTIKVEFEEGTEIVCTPDHQVLTFDGDWMRADSLSAGDSLRGLHYRYDVAIKQTDGRWKPESRAVGEWMAGRPLDSSEHVHHLADPTRLDNRPESLEVLEASEHHSRTHTGREVDREWKARKRAQVLEWKETPQGREHYRRNASTAGKRLWAWVNSLPDEEREAWLKSRGRKPKRQNHRVARISEGPRVDVYDIEVEGLHNFVAGGVVVHNCISAMEAQAAGACVVCSDYGALRETVQAGEMVATPDGPDEVWREEFVHAAVAALRGDVTADPEARMWALRQDWSGVAEAWEARYLALDREPIAA